MQISRRGLYKEPLFCKSYNLFVNRVIELNPGPYKDLILALYCRDGYEKYCQYKWEIFVSSVRKAVTSGIKRKGYTKRSRTHEILGCDYETFKAHIEKQFTKGMSWDNHGEWHLDHIYPVSLAKTEEELIKLNHYTNFQPLWASENISKGNKIIEPIQMKLRI